MDNGLTGRGRALVVGLGAAFAVAAGAAPSLAADPQFDPICGGRVSLGEERTEGQMNYNFGCSLDIKGYSVVVLNRGVDAFDTEPIVLDAQNNPASGESYSCSGPIPGSGVGCAGIARAGHRVNGSLNLTTDPCKGQRPQVVVTVADANGSVAGPFPLVSAKPGPASRPLDGCPAAAKKQRHRRRHATRR